MKSNIMQPPKQAIYPLFYQTFSQSEFFLKFCVKVPCIIIWLLILFVYFSYAFLYLYPLITDTYNYDTHNSEPPLPIFKAFLTIDNNLFQQQNRSKRGWILCFILHYLLFWFLVSMMRTMYTDPGGTPNEESEWAKNIEEIANDYLDFTKKTLRLIYKNEKNSYKSQNITGQNSPSDPLLVKDSENFIIDPLIEPCDLGSIGSNEFLMEENEAMNKEALDIVMGREVFRYCQYCRSFKPLRTHHCRQCGRCVRKMDHHCQWVLNCIGLYNYKYFLNMLFYTVFTLFFVLFTFTKCVSDVALNPNVEGFTLYWVLMLYVLGLVLLLIVTGFLGFHVWLICKGKTTLEYFEKAGKEGKMKKTHWINYDKGIIDNFFDVFTKNPLLWCIPFGINEKVDGLYKEFEEPMIKQNWAEFMSENMV